MAKTYYLSATNSDLSSGVDFNKVLASVTETAGTIAISLSPSEQRESRAFAPAGDPSTGGTNTGTFTVEVEVVSANANVQLSVSAARINSSGALASTAPMGSAQNLGSTGVKTFTVTNPGLGAWQLGDRFAVQYLFQNLSAKSPQSATIRTGTTDTEVTVPWGTSGGNSGNMFAVF